MNIKKLKSLLFPPVWLISMLVIYTAASLTYVFVNSLENNVFGYISYAISAYTLVVFCMWAYKSLPNRYKQINERIYSNQYGKKFLTDVEYRAKLSLYTSVAINIVYSVFKLASGIYFRSYWWGAIAFYYIALSLTRFLLLSTIRKSKRDPASVWRRYRACAFTMLVMNLALSAVVFMMVRKNHAFIYPEVIIITIAAYTFYMVIASITDMVRYRNHKNPLVSASKLIGFAAALVSLLNMETAMLARYGNDDAFSHIMILLTGSAVCAAVLLISVYMIIKSGKELKRLKEQ